MTKGRIATCARRAGGSLSCFSRTRNLLSAANVGSLPKQTGIVIAPRSLRAARGLVGRTRPQGAAKWRRASANVNSWLFGHRQPENDEMRRAEGAEQHGFPE